MDQGSPGLPANRVGVEAEKAALDRGVGAQYPAADGIPELKREASRFVKAFVDIDASRRGLVYLRPVRWLPRSGRSSLPHSACREKIRSCLSIRDFPSRNPSCASSGRSGNSSTSTIIGGRGVEGEAGELSETRRHRGYCLLNPNNPAWICLEDSELAIIGELSTRYGVIVLEDMAYFCMDFRQDLGQPWKAPYPPTVARYTDNYILMLSSSKIFSYAGQRMAVACVSDKLFDTHYPALAERYGDSGVFGQTFVASVLYMITSGCTASTQYGYAEMLRAATDGELILQPTCVNMPDGLNG